MYGQQEGCTEVQRQCRRYGLDYILIDGAEWEDCLAQLQFER